MKRLLDELFTPFGLFVLVIFTFRLTYLRHAPFDLSPDEAYYWDWSRHLAWGYYSKPPMVAWLMAVATKYLGSTAYAVRLPAVYLGTGVIVSLYFLSLSLFPQDRRLALYTTFVAAAIPLFAVYSFLMTIDPPLFFFWALALLVGWISIERERLLWFVFLGIILGGGLLSKQTMVGFYPLLLLYLYLSPEKRHLLGHPGPYATGLVAGVLILPNLLWNARHNWVTFFHTAHHFEVKGVEFPKSFLEFVGGQALVISPIIFGLLIYTAIAALKKGILWRDPRLRYLGLFSLLPLGGVTGLSILREINANWPGPFYLSSLVILSVLALRTRWRRQAGRIRRLYFLGLILGALLCGLTYYLPEVIRQLPQGWAHLDPTLKLKGWKELGEEMSRIKDGHPQAFVLSLKRQIVSELAFYMEGQPVVYRWAGKERSVRSQYELWPWPRELIDRNALLVLREQDQVPEDLKEVFREIAFLKEIRIDLGLGRQRIFRIYLCQGFKGHPRYTGAS
ncbi:ArnT family glycosyltransferase [Thermosulfuriphilus sp.]